MPVREGLSERESCKPRESDKLSVTPMAATWTAIMIALMATAWTAIMIALTMFWWPLILVSWHFWFG